MTTDIPERIHELVTRQARERPGAIALIDDIDAGARMSWADYLAAIDEMAGVLRDRGARSGDRVLVVAENCAATAVAVFAASRIGAAAVPVNARMTAIELGRVIGHAGPILALYTSHVSNDAAAHARAAGAHEIRTRVGTLGLATGLVEPDPARAAEVRAHDAAVILYTTGTTGDPKGVMLTHANLGFAARASAALRDLGPADTIYGALPMTHVFGIASVLAASACAGAALRLVPRFRPEALHAALVDGVTVFPAVPQMHALLMQHVRERGLERLEGTALRYVSSGGAPLDPAWKRKAEAFYGLALQNGYGMTESTAGICGTANPIGSGDTSAGPPFPGIEVRLGAGRPERPSGGAATDAAAAVGEILTRGPHVMGGYFMNPAETARAVDAEGWLHTGDLGRIDAEGRVHVVGRCKELIIRGGFNVYPPEVEAALNDHPLVIQAAVIGRALDGGDEEILAFVQCTDPDAMDEAELRAFVAARLASYKRPARIVFATALPAAATGKVLKHRLLEAFPEELDRPVPD